MAMAFGDDVERGALAVSLSQFAARRLEVGPHEPVELLELLGLADQHVLGDLIEFLGASIASRWLLDDPVVHRRRARPRCSIASARPSE